MNLEEVIKRSPSERFDYPGIINSNDGLFEVKDLNVLGIPSWGEKSLHKKRTIVLEITTWMGISSDAIHYYGKIVADGVYQATLDNPTKPRNLNFQEEVQYPLLNYKYEFDIRRPLPQCEINHHSYKGRWDGYDAGDLVKGYEILEELIDDFKEIIKLRFTGDWRVIIQYPRGNKEIVKE